MKATGIVRKVDELGRVVIPKEIRRTMRIRDGDPLEIFTDKDGEVIFKKYSQMGGLSDFAGHLCETLYKTTGHPAVISDRDAVIAVAGTPRRDVMDRRLSPPLEEVMEGRQVYQYRAGGPRLPIAEGNTALSVYTAAPILAEGDVIGCVILGGTEDTAPMGETEYKLAQTISGFLGRHMES